MNSINNWVSYLNDFFDPFLEYNNYFFKFKKDVGEREKIKLPNFGRNKKEDLTNGQFNHKKDEEDDDEEFDNDSVSIDIDSNNFEKSDSNKVRFLNKNCY